LRAAALAALVFEMVARRHGPLFLAHPLGPDTRVQDSSGGSAGIAGGIVSGGGLGGGFGLGSSSGGHGSSLSFHAPKSNVYSRWLQVQCLKAKPVNEGDFTQVRLKGRCSALEK
jgi:hypothetical protein